MSASARVIIGVPMYNHAHKLREALDSLLGQIHGDIGLMLVDDCSTDDTDAICRQYAARDPRIRYHRNQARLGMIDNWRAAFDLAHLAWPDAEYFAWGSDHDLWHPWWLTHLVRELDEHPEAVLAYPLGLRIDGERTLLWRKAWRFDTAGETRLLARFARTIRHMSAGNMIYGLFRVDALRRAGVFRHVLVPDRMLLTELALYGQFRQVARSLWFRRWYGRLFSLGRQRTAFFPNGRPAYAYLPWWISHTALLALNLGVRGTGTPDVSRAMGFRLAFRYIWSAGLLHAWQQLRELRLKILERAVSLRPHETRMRLYWRSLRRRADAHWVFSSLRKAVSSKQRRRAAGAGRRGIRRAMSTMVRVPGRWLLQTLRSIPIVRDKAIPWLIRQELETIPTAPVVGDMRRVMAKLQKGTDPILVGPWISEVGFELLYWIPFLKYAAETYKLDPSRLVVVSRGGAAAWYAGLADRYVDIFDLYSVDEYRRRNEDRWAEAGHQKHYDANDFDREILARAKDRLGLPAARTLHPSVMFGLLRYYWYEKAPVGLLNKHTRYGALPAPGPVPPDIALPADYVAVRFYFRPSFPDTPENRRFAAGVVRRLAQDHPVVLLNTGIRVDDHEDLDLSTGMGVHHLGEWMTPSSNLDLQSRVIAGARAFVGTYGGLSYLGPYYRVPTMTFYSNAAELVPAHLDVTWRLCRTMGSPLVLLNVTEAPLVRSVLEGLPV